MLTIIPAINRADPRVLDKTSKITYGSPINCDVYHECNIMNPVFLLEYSYSHLDYNYLKVPSWNRYYYINDVTLAPGGRMYISCSEDVLMGNKDAILALTAYAYRSESSTERYAVDDKVQSLILNYRTHLDFSGSFGAFSGFNYLLTVKGGKLSVG